MRPPMRAYPCDEKSRTTGAVAIFPANQGLTECWSVDTTSTGDVAAKARQWLAKRSRASWDCSCEAVDAWFHASNVAPPATNARTHDAASASHDGRTRAVLRATGAAASLWMRARSVSGAL